jgi:hypothetical protein
MSGDATWELSQRGGEPDFPCADRTTPTDGPFDRLIACADAARLLDVPATALLTWSERLAFPCDVGDASGPRFRRTEIEALRDALPDAHSVTGAIRVARLRVHH